MGTRKQIRGGVSDAGALLTELAFVLEASGGIKADSAWLAMNDCRTETGKLVDFLSPPAVGTLSKIDPSALAV
jgi:hypothetical protein